MLEKSQGETEFKAGSFWCGKWKSVHSFFTTRGSQELCDDPMRRMHGHFRFETVDNPSRRPQQVGIKPCHALNVIQCLQLTNSSPQRTEETLYNGQENVHQPIHPVTDDMEASGRPRNTDTFTL